MHFAIHLLPKRLALVTSGLDYFLHLLAYSMRMYKIGWGHIVPAPHVPSSLSMWIRPWQLVCILHVFVSGLNVYVSISAKTSAFLLITAHVDVYCISCFVWNPKQSGDVGYAYHKGVRVYLSINPPPVVACAHLGTSCTPVTSVRRV